MIFTESRTDLIGGVFSKFPAEIHGDHAGFCDRAGAFFAEQSGKSHAEMRRHSALDRLHGNISGFILLIQLDTQQIFCFCESEFIIAAAGGITGQTVESTFQAADT